MRRLVALFFGGLVRVEVELNSSGVGVRGFVVNNATFAVFVRALLESNQGTMMETSGRVEAQSEASHNIPGNRRTYMGEDDAGYDEHPARRYSVGVSRADD